MTERWLKNINFLFNVYKRFFLIFVTFLRFLTFFIFSGTFLHLCSRSTVGLNRFSYNTECRRKTAKSFVHR